MLIPNETVSDANIYKSTVGKHKIERVTQIKYLGITFHDKLTWKSHINDVCAKLSSWLWAISKLMPCADLPTLKSIHFSLIYSHLQYCISSWGLAHANTLNPLEKMH